MSDDKYGSATKLSALDKIMDSGGEYQYLLERKDKGVIKALVDSGCVEGDTVRIGDIEFDFVE